MKQGWLRLWLVTTIAVVAINVWQAFTNSDVTDAIGSSWYCVPGTYNWRTENVVDGYKAASEAEINQKIRYLRTMGAQGNDEDLRITAIVSSGQPILKRVTYWSCSTYWGVFKAALMGLLYALLIGAVFLTIRWIALGFRKQ